MTHLRRVATMGLSWGLTWIFAGLLPARLVAGQIDPEHIAGPLYAGFACGALFAELSGIASGRRPLDELSWHRAALAGAASGLLIGVLPFVIGDNGRYQAGWSFLVVAASATLAGLLGRRWLGEESVWPAVTLAAVITGVLAGALPWFFTTNDSLTRLIPFGLMVGIGAFSGLSAVASRLFVRWMRDQLSHASSAGH